MKAGRVPRRGFVLSTLILVAGSAVARPASAQEDPYLLEGLVVTASPTPRPSGTLATNVTVLDGNALRAQGFVRVQDALRIVPGLTVVQNGSFGASTSVFMRGGESDYTLVLVDGVQVNQPGGAFDFSSLTLDEVERIEIVRGPQSSLYGSDAVAGVVQIVTRDGRGPSRATLGARLGSFGRHDWSVDAGGGGARAGYSLGASRIRTAGILPFNNAYAADIASGAVRYEPDGLTTLRVTGRLSHHRYHFPTDGSGRLVDRNAFTFGDESTLGLDLVRVLDERVDVRARVGSYALDGGTDDAQDGPADTLGYYASSSVDHVRRTTANVSGNVRVRELVATLGWELEREGQRSHTESSSQYGPSSDGSRNTRWNRGYYAHVSGAGEPLSFDAGARLDDNERFGRLGTWQLGAVAHLAGADGPVFRASLGTGIKEPTFYENFATGFARGNPALRPERSRSWEAGVDQRLPGHRASVRATYFHQDFRDLIQYTSSAPTPAAPNFHNVARARAHGVDLQIQAHAGPMQGSASWTWLDTHVVDPGVDSGAGDEFAPGGKLLRRPRTAATADVSARLGRGVSISGMVSVVGAREDRDFTSYPATRVTLPAYTLLDLEASGTLHRGQGRQPDVTIDLRGDNLLDRSYQEVLGYPAPGRAIYLGLRVGLGSEGRP
ncbi:MAG: TonB-dependent receptor [Gemmatimonadetes bacterium]|nr:TonB-dependent receptor [Gemmatimonadota bacterium]